MPASVVYANSETSIDQKDIEAQLQLMVDQYDSWNLFKDSDFTNYWYTAIVTDIDGNGRLELFLETGWGSGSFSCFKMFEVTEDRKQLKLCYNNFDYVKTQTTYKPDILHDEVEVYEYNNRRYLLFEDYTREGWQNNNTQLNPFSLKDGQVYTGYLGKSETSIWMDKNNQQQSSTKYYNAKNAEISKEEYDMLPDVAYPEARRGKMYYKWLSSINSSYSPTNLYNELKESWENFRCEMEDNDISAVLTQNFHLYETGKEVKPEPSVVCSGKTLTKDKDYTVEYKDYDKSGEATVIVKGTGKYTGTVELPYYLVQVEDLEDMYVYTGHEIDPAFSLVLGSKQLKENEDYSLIYKNVTDIGYGEINVTAKGSMSGELTIKFSIVPPTPTNIVVNNKKHEAPRMMKAQWKCQGQEEYDYQYAIDLYKASDDTLVKTEYSFGDEEIVFKDLGINTVYYVRVRAELLADGNVFSGPLSEEVFCTSENKLVPSDFWGVNNKTDSISSEYYQKFFMPAKADSLAGDVGGLCNAMSIAALASINYSSNNPRIPSVESFGVEKLGDIDNWQAANTDNSMRLIDYIRYAKAYCKTRMSTSTWNDNMGNLQGLYDEVKYAESNGRGVLISVLGKSFFSNISHTVVGLEIVEDTSFSSKIRIYDPNFPNNIDRYLILYKSGNVYSSFSLKSTYDYSGLAGTKEGQGGFGEKYITWRTFNAEHFAELMKRVGESNYDNYYLVNINPIMNQWPSEWQENIQKEEPEEHDVEQLYEKYVDLSVAYAMFGNRLPIDHSNNSKNVSASYSFYCDKGQGKLSSFPGGSTISFSDDNWTVSFTVSKDTDIDIKENAEGNMKVELLSQESNSFIIQCIDYEGNTCKKWSIFGSAKGNTPVEIDRNGDYYHLVGADKVSSSYTEEGTDSTKIAIKEKTTEITNILPEMEYDVKYDNSELILIKDMGNGEQERINWNYTTEDKSPSNTPKKILVNNVVIKAPSTKLAAGKRIKLSVNVYPKNATNKKVIWKNRYKQPYTIDQNGWLTISKKAIGKMIVVEAKAVDGLLSYDYDSIEIIVMKGIVKKIKITGKNKVKAGKAIKLKAKVKASKGANKKLRWVSSNTRYATVSGSGKVKTKKAGKGKKVKITAMATDGSGKKASKVIKIK